MPETSNPYIAGSPITGPEMFFGREDIFTFVRQALTGQHRDHVLVLYGQRRTGKTSVLYQMNRQLDDRYISIFIDLHGLSLNGLSGFLWELANHIARVLRRDYQVILPALDRTAFRDDPRSAFENIFLESVWGAIDERNLLLMLDEAIRLEEQVRAGKLENQVFDYLRHLMQHHPRLNFLFSLGSGLEEMQKEYAFLFNVALYKKITFLDRASAEALITEPMKDICPYLPGAVDRILEVTSGHPYFTQLVCHSLFNRCHGSGGISTADVEAVLDEAVERGLAVLKHVWEESTPGEKAVLAAMATGSTRRGPEVTPANHGWTATPDQIRRIWADRGVNLTESETARSLRSLVARDVIAGAGAYSFTVDLMRLWVQKFRRLEWVKEEIEDASLVWVQRELMRRDREILEQGKRSEGIKSATRKAGSRTPLGLTVVYVLVALAGLFGIVYFASNLLGPRPTNPGQPETTTPLSEEISPTTASQAATPTLGGNVADVINNDELGQQTAKVTHAAACRGGPGEVYERLDFFGVGTSLAIEGRNDDSTWWKVKPANSQQSCWISGEAVSVLPTIPIVAAPPTPVVTAQPTPVVAGQPTPVFAGPFFGNIKHNPVNAETEGDYFGVSLRNFVLEGSVYNPYSHSEHPWSFAVGFRWINGVYTVIIVDSDGSWRYGYYDEPGSWNGLISGKLNNLRLNVGEANHIRLVAYEADGCLYINEAPVADLDLSGIDQPGDIFLSIGGSEMADAITHYENFFVYRTSSLDCP